MLRLSRKRLTPKSSKLYRRSSSSETSPPWSDLTPLALERIRALLDSSLHDVLLRSVCRNWRTSLACPRHRNRSPNFPINLPRIPETTGTSNPVMPNYSCIYHISPADDPSHGWLVKSLDSAPNTFTLVDLLNTYRVSCPPNSVRNSLDLLQLRVSEVCKCYRIDGVGSYDLRKVLFLPNFVKNVAFTVVVVVYSGNMYYCNDGDSAWTAIHCEDYKFHDVILFKGIYHAVTDKGCLLSLDSDLNLKKVLLPPLDLDHHILTYKRVVDNNLVAFESDLYLVSVVSICELACMPHEVRIFKWMLNCWRDITNLGDTILLSSSDVSIGLSAKDFKGCKGNCVYLTHPFLNSPYNTKYSDLGFKRIPHEEYEVYDLDECDILSYKKKRRRTKIFWPPPKWMQQPTS